MKGLLMKDLYVLSRQMRLFLLMIVIFSVVPGMNMTIFAVVYAAMMPYTALAYDERSHWDQLAAMMPYSTKDIVLSKYVLGWLFTGFSSLLALTASFVLSRFTAAEFAPASIFLAFCVGALMMDLTLPAMFRFGVERGRMLFILVMVVAACGSAGLLMGLAEAPKAAALMSGLQIIVPAVTVALTFLSVTLSIRLYQKRNT